MRLPRLHLVTDDAVLRSPDFAGRAERLLARYGPAVALQLRGHGMTGSELGALADRLRAASLDSGSCFLLNDRVDVALATRADGVQLGPRSLPVAHVRRLLAGSAWIGFSAHSTEEAEQAVLAGTDFIILGTIYRSATHTVAPAAGPALVRAVSDAVDAPVLGIGGVTPERVMELLAEGAYGAAVLGGIWHCDDPVARVAEYLAVLPAAEAEVAGRDRFSSAHDRS